MGFEVRAARPEDVRGAIALLDTVWAWQNNEALLKCDPGYELDQTRLGVLDGQVVAVAQVFDRALRLGGSTARVGCVGNVATAASHRRKGYATAVLRDAIVYMQERSYDFSMLYAAAPKLYAALGWQIVPERVTSFALRPAPLPPETDPYVVRQGRWEEDLEAIAAVYDEYNAGRTGTVVRSLPYWRACRLWIADEDDARFLVVERDGAIVAYVRGGRGKNLIMELGYRATAADVVPVLFAAIQKRFAPGRFVAHFAQDPIIDSYLAEHATDLSHDPGREPGYEPAMFRPMKGQSLDELAGFCFYYSDHF